ncbi:MAG: sensor histidine kinase [Clostridia bacterium]
MKRMTHQFGAKLTAYLLVVLLGVTTLLCAAGALYFSEGGYYDGTHTSYEESGLASEILRRYDLAAYQLYFYGQQNEQGADNATDSYSRKLDVTATNYRYTLSDETGRIVAGNLAAVEPAVFQHESTFSDGSDPRHGDPSGASTCYMVKGYLLRGLPIQDEFAAQRIWFNRLLTMRYWILVIAGVCILLTIMLLVFLCCAAGRFSDSQQPEIRNLDRIPTDLYLLFGLGVITLVLCSGMAVNDLVGFPYKVLLICLCAGCCIAICTALLCSLSARIKTRTLLKNTILWRILRLVGRLFRWTFHGITVFFRSLPILWKTIVAVVIFAILNLILMITAYDGSLFSAFLLLLFNGAVFVALCWISLQLNLLKKGGEALAAGDTAHRINTAKMYWEFKRHAENLNSIQSGMSRAIEERLKSERMKTDLITNVSHDLKTPLTSIVNYVDLLKKEEPLSSQAAEYVAVLDRQAQKLKKLTEDLVEASKASSGAMPVNLVSTNLQELLNQSLAEYTVKFAAASLTPVMNLPDEPVHILADGRLIWRVFDNLLGNAAKYAMPGTRIYIDISANGETVSVTFKNVSHEALNISADELQERFVRGDAARASEGSGLGLTIARDLTVLQHGILLLSIDGDLFSASVRMPLISDKH